MVDDRKVSYVVEQGVYGKVAAEGVLPGGAELVLQEKPVFFRVLGKFLRIGLAAEGRDFDHLVAPEPDVRQPEPAPDQETVAKQFLDLLWSSVGPDVEVLGVAVQQQVADAAADQVGFVAVAVQAIEDLEGVLVDPATGDMVL